MSKQTIKRRLDDAKRHERHNNVAETRYWCDQYKQIATEALAEQPAPAQPWVGLTDEERRHLKKCNQQHDAFALAVEALLKEKNQ